MRISVITIVYNNDTFISKAIDSVLYQDYPDLEYIVVDGQSVDNTIPIINSYGNQIDTFISEKDNGLYDAINKGIELATGDVIGLLHSDDLYASSKVISTVANTFAQKNVDSVYGNLIYIDRRNPNKIVRKWISGTYERQKFLFGWMPPHPTFFVRRDFFQQYGSYDLSFGSAADYELMLRFLFKYGISTAYIPDILVKMRVGGKSNATFINRFKANNQDYRAWLENDLNPRFYTRFLKPLQKLPQYFVF